MILLNWFRVYLRPDPVRIWIPASFASEETDGQRLLSSLDAYWDNVYVANLSDMEMPQRGHAMLVKTIKSTVSNIRHRRQIYPSEPMTFSATAGMHIPARFK